MNPFTKHEQDQKPGISCPAKWSLRVSVRMAILEPHDVQDLLVAVHLIPGEADGF